MIAAIYARKSTDQSGMVDEAKSVTRQIAHARAYATRKGWTVRDEHVYVDDGISGAEFAARPGFLRLMNALKPAAPFQVLIMSEESRLGREAIETAYALKQIVRAGVRVFFYLEDRERTLDTPTDKIMLSLTAFADELEREKARQRVTDAMRRKAQAGHVCGGRTFGYDNVEVPNDNGTRAYVTYRINETEAATVRRIFTLAGQGEGLKGIAKRLNTEGLVAPRPQQGRPRGWAPSTVREVLYREMYRGQRVWNKSRKRDAWGQKHQQDRPRTEWLTIECEDLRIVTETAWQDAHARMTRRREAYELWKRGEPGGATNGQGVRTRYFLTGFATCACCGGSMQAMTRPTHGGRIERYCCATYWNRGVSVCGNGRMVDMRTADLAVADLLKAEVLRPAVLERALDLAVEAIAAGNGHGTRAALTARVQTVETELRNLSETAAKGGAVPAVLEALARRDDERRRLLADLGHLADAPMPTDASALRRQLRACVDDWGALLREGVVEARPVLALVLDGQRMAFTPVSTGYRLTVPIAFDRVLSAAIPALQDRVASPAGFEPALPP